MRTRFIYLLLFPLLVHSQDRNYEEQPAHNFKPPPSPALSPEEALKTFRLEKGFRIELVAAEPLVEDPVAITFDEHDNMYVVELRSYMQDIKGTDGAAKIGRVKYLKDLDGDGQMETSSIFLDKLDRPRAITAANGGVLVAEHTQLWFAKDTDGDGIADIKELVDPKFATSGSVEHRDNGLVWNIDNWYYNAKSGQRYRFRNGKWERGKMHKRGQWGISQDNLGRLFYGYNWSQLHADRFPAGYLALVPNFKPALAANAHLTLDQSVKPIRMGTGVNRGYRPGILDKRGYLKEFASSCAPHIYRGNLFPKEYHGNAFVCGPAANLIKRNIIVEDGLEIFAKPTGLNHEFLASTDERFRPVALKDAPDGSMYVVDMYRGVIQLAPFMTTYLRNESLSRGLDKPIHYGRIYRITHEVDNTYNRLPSANPFFLSDESAWARDTAQRLMVESQDPKHFQLLEYVLENTKGRLPTIHVLWTLEGLQYPMPEKLFPFLDSKDPEIQIHAIRVLESLMARQPEKLRAELLARIPDYSPKVALQGLLTLGTLEPGKCLPEIARISAKYLEHPLFREAMVCTLSGQEEAFIRTIGRLDGWEPPTAGQNLLLETLQLLMESRQETNTADISHLSQPDQARYREGQQLYSSFCAQCHGVDGRGMSKLGPPLKSSEWVEGHWAVTARILFKGMEGPVTVNGRTYGTPDILPAMPPLFSLKDSQLAAILGYIRNSWGHKGSIPTGKQLQQIREITIGKPKPWTEAELRPMLLGE